MVSQMLCGVALDKAMSYHRKHPPSRERMGDRTRGRVIVAVKSDRNDGSRQPSLNQMGNDGDASRRFVWHPGHRATHQSSWRHPF
jgi:hypothetical protein